MKWKKFPSLNGFDFGQKSGPIFQHVGMFCVDAKKVKRTPSLDLSIEGSVVSVSDSHSLKNGLM